MQEPEITSSELMNNLAATELKQLLQSGEVLIWAGQPKKGIVFEISDIFKTIYVIVLFVLTYFAIKLLAGISIWIAIPVGIIFFSACILLGIGRFVIDAVLRKKTFYGLTNKRIIIESGMSNKKVQSIYLDLKPKIEFQPGFGNTYTIDVGIQEPIRRGGLSWIPNVKANTSLYRLSEGKFVHQKIREILKMHD